MKFIFIYLELVENEVYELVIVVGLDFFIVFKVLVVGFEDFVIFLINFIGIVIYG